MPRPVIFPIFPYFWKHLPSHLSFLLSIKIKQLFSYTPTLYLSLGWLEPSSSMDPYPEQKGLSRGGCASPGSRSRGGSLCRSAQATWGKIGV